MTVGEIGALIESWAPKEISWDRDNVGLQVGSARSRVRSILICLDVTEQTIREALTAGANLIISHHPLLFRPLRNLTGDGHVEHCVTSAVRNRINVYSAHTNLDFTTGGTSFSLAEAVGITAPKFLRTTYRPLCKIVTYVPQGSVDRVADAMADAGAGMIGNYDHCSFRIAGTGTFRGNEQSNPSSGRRGRIESVDEIRLEMIVEEWNAGRVTDALRQTHPYEEVAYEIYAVQNVSNKFGMGVIGTLTRPVMLKTFLRLVKLRLNAGSIRYTGQPTDMIRTVALCGGSGSELLPDAISQGADAFVTADVRYHVFQDAAERIALVDAGHYETELPVVRTIAQRLRAELKSRAHPPRIRIARTVTNPIMSF